MTTMNYEGERTTVLHIVDSNASGSQKTPGTAEVRGRLVSCDTDEDLSVVQVVDIGVEVVRVTGICVRIELSDVTHGTRVRIEHECVDASSISGLIICAPQRVPDTNTVDFEKSRVVFSTTGAIHSAVSLDAELALGCVKHETRDRR